MNHCPVCGAENATCRGTDAGIAALTSAMVYPPMQTPEEPMPYRSIMRVYEDGRLRHALGGPIPVAEALRQGIVLLADLTPAARKALAAHGIDPEAIAMSRLASTASTTAAAVEKPPKDKMIRSGQTRKKAG